MKTRITVLYGALFAALLIAVPMMADARPFGHGGSDCWGRGSGGGWLQSVPEGKRDAVRALMREQWEKVQPIHDKLWIKRTTLEALQSNPNVKPAELTALIEEMASLRSHLRNEHKAFADRVKQETGLEVPFGCDMQGPGFRRHRGMDGSDGHHRGMDGSDGPRDYPAGRHGKKGPM